MTTWDASRSAPSALLLTRLAEERGVRANGVLDGTGLSFHALRSPRTEISGRQELAVLRNLQAACDEPDLALEAGTRYHLTT